MGDYMKYLQIKWMKFCIFTWLLLITVSTLQPQNNNSKLDQQISPPQQVLFNDPVNLATQIEIGSIWTIDQRPEKVILQWCIDKNISMPTKIFKKIPSEKYWDPHPFENYPPLVGSIYNFDDMEVNEDSTYGYWVMMNLSKPVKILYKSFEVYTVPQPVIGVWGDLVSSTRIHYSDGVNDSVWIDKSTLHESVSGSDQKGFFVWEAAQTRFLLKTSNNKTLPDTSAWLTINPDTPKIKLNYPPSFLQSGMEILIQVQTRDNVFIQNEIIYGNTSRWSESVSVLMDCDPPADVTDFTVNSQWDNNTQKTICKLNWKPGEDILSGLKTQVIYRKINKGEWLPITKEFGHNICSSSDSLPSQVSGIPILYKINCKDSVGNKRESDGVIVVGVTLSAPSIKLLDYRDIEDVKYIQTKFATFDVSELNPFYLIGFNIESNSQRHLTLPSRTNSLSVPLSVDGFYQIRAQALFQIPGQDDILKSAWSNLDSFYREYNPPKCVTNLFVKNDPNDYLGRLTLNWSKPSDDAWSYLIERKSENNSYRIICSGITGTSWVDEDTNLFDFDYYTYRIRAKNIFGKEHPTCSTCSEKSNYHNKAPKILEMTPNADLTELTVKWDQPKPIHFEMNNLEYTLNVFEDLISQPPCTTITDKDTITTIDITEGHLYILRVNCKLLSRNIYSAWSQDTTFDVNAIETIKIFELQALPSLATPRISIAWNYTDTASADSFRVERLKFNNNEWKNDTNECFPKKTLKYENSQFHFIDDIELIKNVLYKYCITPIRGKMNGYKSTSPEIIAQIGRMYNPGINTSIYGLNPNREKLYFDGRPDSIKIKWKWENNNIMKVVDSIWIAYSNNPGFANNGNLYADTIKISRLEHDSIGITILSKEPLCIHHHDPIYLKITAIDKWHNIHNCWSSDWDGIIEVFKDCTIPTPTNLTNFNVRAVQSPDSFKVQVKFEWDPKPTDTGSGLHQYHFIGYTDTIKFDSLFNDTAKVNKIITFNLDLLESTEKETCHVQAEDYVGHLGARGKGKSWFRLPTPKKFEAYYYTKYPDSLHLTWEAVPGCSGYYIEWYGDLNKLGSDFLRSWGENHEIIKDPLKTTIDIRRLGLFNKTYFHALAFYGNFFHPDSIRSYDESGWTEAKKALPIKLGFLSKSADPNLVILERPFSIANPYPNPFNVATTLNVQLPRQSHLFIKIYDVLGREITILNDAILLPGQHLIRWDGKNSAGHVVASGLYFFVIKGEDFFYISKCLFLQ